MRISAIPLLGALVLAGCSEWQQLAAPAPASFDLMPAQATTYSGDATVVQVSALGPPPITLVLVRAGPLPESGGSDEESLLEANVPGLLTAEVLHASTVGAGSHSRSEASVANVSLTVAGASISAAFLMSRAEARCAGGNATASGSSQIAELNINGQPIAVSGQPNQTIEPPGSGLRVVINEQNSSVSGNTADITVNALHVTVSHPVTGEQLADVIISQAHADISCAAPPSQAQCKDFVTGGGWITGTPSGAKGNFGVAGGIKNGAFWGHLNYIDHGPSGPKVKGTGVTAYVVVEGTTTRHIEGTAEVNGASGFTYAVDVTDNGEPGRSDTFVLSVSNGYSAGGTLGGGNIQLHKPCDGGDPL